MEHKGMDYKNNSINTQSSAMQLPCRNSSFLRWFLVEVYFLFYTETTVFQWPPCIHPNSSKDDSYIDTQLVSYWDFFSVKLMHKAEFSAGITGRETSNPLTRRHDDILVTIATSMIQSIVLCQHPWIWLSYTRRLIQIGLRNLLKFRHKRFFDFWKWPIMTTNLLITSILVCTLFLQYQQRQAM
jgi:hypothetical protein